MEKNLPKAKELAAEHIRRFQQWTVATEFRVLYEAGARVWIKHPEKVWEGAVVVENYKEKVLKVSTENDGTVVQLPIPKDESLPPLRNPDILIGENDLTSLSYLHEPAVMYNLQVRFCMHSAIYTYCGSAGMAMKFTQLCTRVVYHYAMPSRWWG
ncbi:hypothetical protein PR048_028589 [Dryococelus australis]|uniref:Myosin N-terminal SH3-like domain-containing protein n=1 Tax=Dryococelus australis TaxID=614101 RepID=A0ABQ9GBP0_9NEOP|nr:hypothetical protein PR048_028589 [Dryococelus australis]